MLLSSGWGPGHPEIRHFPGLSIDERRRRHGSGRYVRVKSVIAGESTSFIFTFEIGAQQVATGGRLGITWRWPFDWANLQSDDPEQDDFVAVTRYVSGESTELPGLNIERHRYIEPPGLTCKHHQFTGVEPWHHYLEIQNTSGALKQNDRVQIKCQDWHAPTCSAKAAGFLMLLDPTGDERWIRLPDPPTFEILPGPAKRLVLIAPSDVVVGEWVEVLLRAEDRWGNAALIDDAFPHVNVAPQNGTGLNVGEPRVLRDPPARWYPVQFNSFGTSVLVASVPGTDLRAESNPVRVERERPAHRVFWGDFHSGQCEIGCGQGTLADHYRFGRDAAGLQFITHQANDHYVRLEDWQHVREVTEAFHEPGRYVPFLGCEWSPPTIDGGDRNVAYLHDEPRLRRSGRFFTETDPDPEPDLPRAPEFLAAMKGQDVLINVHVGGRPTNLDYHEPAIERLAEIHSTHGTSEWFIFDALSRGYQPAITAGTDGVMGRPGACQPGRRLIRNVPNGLTAVLAEELTRAANWDALKSRRCYATSGPRILLNVSVDGHPMGAKYKSTGQPNIRIDVVGTAALERIDLFRGTDVLFLWNLAKPLTTDCHTIRILWSGTQKRGTARAQTVNWDGELRLENGSIQSVRRVGYFSAADDVWRTGESTLEWRSATAGNSAGIILEIDGGSESVGRFFSGPTTFDFALAQASKEPRIVDAGGVERRVTIGPAPDDNGPRVAQLSYDDPHPITGTAPYWVRVVQVDQEKAWSSPVFVVNHQLRNPEVGGQYKD